MYRSLADVRKRAKEEFEPPFTATKLQTLDGLWQQLKRAYACLNRVKLRLKKQRDHQLVQVCSWPIAAAATLQVTCRHCTRLARALPHRRTCVCFAASAALHRWHAGAGVGSFMRFCQMRVAAVDCSSALSQPSPALLICATAAQSS